MNAAIATVIVMDIIRNTRETDMEMTISTITLKVTIVTAIITKRIARILNRTDPIVLIVPDPTVPDRPDRPDPTVPNQTVLILDQPNPTVPNPTDQTVPNQPNATRNARITVRRILTAEAVTMVILAVVDLNPTTHLVATSQVNLITNLIQIQTNLIPVIVAVLVVARITQKKDTK